jgi:beta-alanine--pyruvate transaminase
VGCFEKGLLIRVTGDIVALSPPLIIESSPIDNIVSVLGEALRKVA